jgi:hypothetical protein
MTSPNALFTAKQLQDLLGPLLVAAAALQRIRRMPHLHRNGQEAAECPVCTATIALEDMRGDR